MKCVDIDINMIVVVAFKNIDLETLPMHSSSSIFLLLLPICFCHGFPTF